MDAKNFREDLARKSKEKRALKFEEFKKRKATMNKKPTETEALIAVRDALKALTDLIVAKGKDGPVTFTVLEYSDAGKVKSFKVE